MSGVQVALQLLLNDAGVTALVPSSRIVAGALPITAAPAISVSLVSSVDLNIPDPGETRFVTDRVQIDAYASNYPEKRAILKAVKKATADKRPIVAGLTNVAVHTDNAGPDFTSEDGTLHRGSQDLRIKYNEET